MQGKSVLKIIILAQVLNDGVTASKLRAIKIIAVVVVSALALRARIRLRVRLPIGRPEPTPSLKL